ncbi:TetR/AcrR family transcriptional regulator [Phaeobacter piscinae]|uniref:Transcriptional regulator, TetR family n=1 Tax=Phaeobacter piscinae TaxID=1580596 RepID=A0ABN5DED7_9RHOB|nr:TetR/AcrR family transcriptional regulator [Phaeobacter piscinae]ATG35098.1 transcriptional regulator, TetR family [Phaeobacter piscinae]ATG39060.1 transcriptional regulator, TetR family [Phaeobacter piscinae]AUQ85618.1 transcriptional regulator, TetR family [Phaeobacter piscinae]AUR23502.1 transcriptional regulator, TetR family [Phaeobacter piscinae]
MQKRQKRASEKQTRLVQAGAELFRSRGYDGTSLTDVAKAAGVPPGGVFYHFRTKADLADAVMQQHHRHFSGQLQQIETATPDPRKRLRLFWEGAEKLAADRAALGCPVLALAGDMAADPARPEAAQEHRKLVMAHTLGWLAAQYRALGLGAAQADTAAAGLFATMQGAFAVGHVMNDADIIRRIFSDKRQEQEKAGFL